MANDYLSVNDTSANLEKAQNLLSIIESKRKDPVYSTDLQSESSLFSELFSAFKDFFSNLGKPSLNKRLQKIGSPPKSEDYNKTMLETYNDVQLAYKEIASLSTIMVKDFNYSEAERQMLRNKVQKLSSDSTDYFLQTSGANNQVLLASDTFIDNSKIDLTKLTAGYSHAELVANQGIVTINRTGNVDRAPLVTEVTGLQESVSAWDPTTSTGIYEGLFWAEKNAMRPEGGGLHLNFSSDGTSLYELGASEVDKMPNRMKMFDSNPDTFWEIEYVTPKITGYQNTITGQQISVDQFVALFNNDVNSPNVQLLGNAVVTSQNGSLIENYVPVFESGTTNFLNVNFTVNLSRASTVNWISLNPNNFGNEAYLQVIDIQTSEDGNTFTDLEGFDNFQFNTTLTAQVNKELNPELITDTLSPDKFKYAGQGIWVFAPRQIASIKFNIRQPQSYIQEYDILMVETSQTVTTTTTKTSWFGLSSKTSTSSQTFTNDIAVPYLLGQVAGFDVNNLEPGGSFSSQGGPNIASVLEGGVIGALAVGLSGTAGAIGGALLGAQAGAILGPVGVIIGGLIGLVFGGLFGSTKTSQSVGPQTISRQWTQTNSDRSRFAIGIRDIDIFSYTFDTQSEVISLPYSSPKPISKVMLDVTEQIPIAFDTTDLAVQTNNWIKYYVSVDDGTSWFRISPISHRDTMSEDGVNLVPQIININSLVTGSERTNPLAYIDTPAPVFDIRFRAVLTRPTTITDANSYTPALSDYTLKIYPLGGLS